MRLRISLAILLVVAVLVACAAPSPTPTPAPRPTAPVAPTAAPVPTATPVPTPVGAADVRPSGGEPEWLRPFEAEAGSVSVAAFEAANLGLKLLVPEGAAAQAFVQFQKNGQTLALGNFNLPVFKEGQVKFPPVFNTPDFGFLMGWVDNEGNWLYHIPLQPGVEGRAPVVYQKGDTLYEGLVDLQTGKIDPTTERPYWVVMPLQAVKAVMAKYQDAIYVTFWDKDGKQLENERIKVCDLPPEPTPTPEVKPLKMGKIYLVDKSNRMDVRWKDENSMAKVQEAFLIMWAKKSGTTVEQIKAQMARREKVTGFVTYIPLDEQGNMGRKITQKVDLAEAVKIVVWDVPFGFGSAAASRIQFKVEHESLTIFIYKDNKAIYPNLSPFYNTSVNSGLIEALSLIYNNGIPAFRGDPSFPAVEELRNEIEPLLAPKDPNSIYYLPEIQTIPTISK